jgi:hypothetical protein
MQPIQFTAFGVLLVCVTRPASTPEGFPMVRAVVLDAVIHAGAYIERSLGTAERAAELAEQAIVSDVTAWDTRSAVDRAIVAARRRVSGVDWK